MIFALSAGRDASPEVRERVALDEAGVRALLAARPDDVSELVILCTCHRTELYAAGVADETNVAHALAAMFPALHPTDQSELRFMRGIEAVEHLFRVACGLDSLVVGEQQILGQVRRAQTLAREASATGPKLSGVFERAVKLGRAARARTGLGTQRLSIGTLAVRHLVDSLGPLAGREGAIIGAGEAATDAAVALHEAGARLRIASRTRPSAERLAARVGGTALQLDDLPRVFEASEFGIVAVSGGVAVRAHDVPARSAPLVLVDISVPRAVDIAGRADVDTRSIEDLTAPESPEVLASIADVETMIGEALADMERTADARANDHAIVDLRARAELIVREEVARALASLNVDAEGAARLEALGRRIANKLMHGPTVALRDGDEKTRDAIREAFGLEP